MHYVKLFFLASFLLSTWMPLSAQTSLASCLEQGKREYAAHQYEQAQATFTKCLGMDPENADTLLSLGGVCLTQDNLDGAKEYFLDALKYMKRNSPYLSYTYSMLGDIALKQQQNKAALAYYNHSLRFNEANVNSLVGKGVIIENQGDVKAAAEVYKTALAVEPLNLIARKRLIALEPKYFNDEEILEALKLRHAILPEKETVSDFDRELFAKIHSAEQRGGIDYLKKKYNPLPGDYMVILFKDTDFAREVLTLNGYNAMQKQIGQDAVAVFQKTGVPVSEIFDLRDMKGEKIFLPDSTLTPNGFTVYNEALQGRKSFLLPTEEVPPSQEKLQKIAQQEKKLKENGYLEISGKEMAQLRKQTDCSDETLRRQLGVYFFPVSKKEMRYFVLARPAADMRKEIAWHYIARMRRRKNPSIQVPENKIVKSHEDWNEKVCASFDGKLSD